MTIAPRYPEVWEVGMLVEYVRPIEWGPSVGTRGRIAKIRETEIGFPANQYQVFWVEMLDGYGIFWTTPQDVKWIQGD